MFAWAFSQLERSLSKCLFYFGIPFRETMLNEKCPCLFLFTTFDIFGLIIKTQTMMIREEGNHPDH